MWPALFAIVLAIWKPATLPVTVKYQQTFEVQDASCAIKVLDRNDLAPDEKIVIVCDGNEVLNRDLGFAGIRQVDLVDDFHSGTKRALITYESGVLVSLLVIEISTTPSKTSSKVVYEHSSHSGTETFEEGNVILEQVQRRFERAVVLPQGTNMYHWQDGQYRFIESFRWRRGSSWTDRYCILYKPESCPAHRSTIRLLDEYER